MKELYFGELKRDAEGNYWVDDNKVDRKEFNEIDLSIYLGSLWGAAVERLRLEKRTGSLLLTINYKEEGEK